VETKAAQKQPPFHTWNKSCSETTTIAHVGTKAAQKPPPLHTPLQVLPSVVSKSNTLNQARKFVCTILKKYSSCWPPMIRISLSTIFSKFGSKKPLMRVRNLSLSLIRGPWQFRGWAWGLGPLKLASGCWKAFIWMCSGHNWTRNHDHACLLLGNLD
jgi:hypothetical protein